MIYKYNKDEYYTLKELENIVDLKTRQLKYRMKTVKMKYADNKQKLYKGKKSWNIHRSIIFEFDRVKLTKRARELKGNSLVTINPDGAYDKEYNLELLYRLIADLREHSPAPVTCKYFIEQGESGYKYHIHFVTNLTTDYTNLIRRHANYYTKTITDVRCVYEEWELLKYLQKDIRAKGEIPL